MRQRLSFLDPPTEEDPFVMQLRPPEKREQEFKEAVNKEKPNSTELALERTKLAIDRTDLAILRSDLANKRTLLAYVRTAITVALLAQSQNNSNISIAGIIFIVLAFVDYVYHYLWIHPNDWTLPKTLGNLLYFTMTIFPAIVAIIAVYVLGLNI